MRVSLPRWETQEKECLKQGGRVSIPHLLEMGRPLPNIAHQTGGPYIKRVREMQAPRVEMGLPRNKKRYANYAFARGRLIEKPDSRLCRVREIGKPIPDLLRHEGQEVRPSPLLETGRLGNSTHTLLQGVEVKPYPHLYLGQGCQENPTLASSRRGGQEA
ncbi:hypothetical protein BHM03_00014828 [Ensete ventricosum]|uniref:Uncharacterized protein n=1 Tax=Ensete ventricosum TaxID=4639 RepID=A0A445MEG7_ENSVE|nr:hypothetical protein BHM03_00014828 [Ensete ventricosum]